MIEIIYKIIKQALAAYLPDAKLIDLDLAQYDQRRDDAVRTTPAIYIKLSDPVWKQLPGGVQKSVMTIMLTVVSHTAYGDERDITDKDNIDHLRFHDGVYKCLLNKRFLLSYLPEYVSVAGTTNDRQMIETITRISSKHPVAMNNLIITSQVFEAVVYDYSAQVQLIAVLAQLELHVHLVKNLDDDVPVDPPSPKVWDYEGVMTIGTDGNEVPEVGYRFYGEGNEENIGTLLPAFEYFNFKGQSFLYYEYGSGYLFASAVVSEIEINSTSYLDGTVEEYMTKWLINADPFPPAGNSVDIKVIFNIAGNMEDRAIYRQGMSDMLNPEFGDLLRSYYYKQFQATLALSEIYQIMYVSATGKQIRRHVTHIAKEFKKNFEVAKFLCNELDVSIDILEVANIPGTRHVDLLVNNEFIVEIKTLSDERTGELTEGKVLSTIRVAKYQHRYSVHSAYPLVIFLDNQYYSHAAILSYLNWYKTEHVYVYGFYVRTGDFFDYVVTQI